MTNLELEFFAGIVTSTGTVVVPGAGLVGGLLDVETGFPGTAGAGAGRDCELAATTDALARPAIGAWTGACAASCFFLLSKERLAMAGGRLWIGSRSQSSMPRFQPTPR